MHFRVWCVWRVLYLERRKMKNEKNYLSTVHDRLLWRAVWCLNPDEFFFSFVWFFRIDRRLTTTTTVYVCVC